jgi:aryl-alcohol dehydrogenase-like predicted oxidoreductase
MDYTRLGSTGLKISRICLGMMSFGTGGAREWHLDEDAAEPIVRQAVEAGVGASSMSAWQFAKAQRVAQIPFVSMQNHYNLVYREEEREMIPLCVDQGVGVIPYSPLARGLLAREAGTTARSGADPVADDLYDSGDLEVVEVIRELAKQRGVAPAQIALAWLLGATGVNAPIVGATKIRHVEDAVAAVGLTLTPDERARLEAPYRPQRVIA